MTINELKEALYSIFVRYFPNTTIVWAEQKKLVKPSGDFLTLKLRNYNRPKHQIKPSNQDAPIGNYSLTENLKLSIAMEYSNRSA